VVAWNGPVVAHDCHRSVAGHDSITWLDLGPPVGAARARNLGVAALGSVDAIAFCDADDRVAANWLAELMGPLVEGSMDLVGGALLVVSDGKRRSNIVPGVDYWHLQAMFGGNCAMSYKAWRTLGGFDELLLCCEDTDLAWRAAGAGLRVGVCPAAAVEVALRSRGAEFRQRMRWGYWAVSLLRKHDVQLDHLPNVTALLEHKAASGYARSVPTAALGQWIGHLLGRLARLRR
jgi:GT2 family glycosyltransferase